MRKTIHKLALLAVLFGATTVYAESLPRSAGLDNRVQVFDYSPNQVYVVNAKAGYATLIQLEDDEEIGDDGALGMGLADSWNVAVKGNNVFFKPTQFLPDTNLLLVSNKRTYAFVLSTQETGDLTYIARFNYPKPAETVKTPTVPSQLNLHYVDDNGEEIYIDSRFNTQYYARGNALLVPTNAWDDGVFTYFKYAHAGDLPAIYRVMPDGSEALLNYHIDNDTVAIHELGAAYRLRLGESVAEVLNNNVRRSAFNTTGTSDSNWIRVDK